MKKLLISFIALILIFTSCACARNTDILNSSAPALMETLNQTGSAADDKTVFSDSSGSSKKQNSSNRCDTSSKKNSSNSTTASDQNNNTQNDTDKKTTTKKCSHSYKKATCSAPKTCSKCGKTEGKTLPHTLSRATCTSPQKCTVCGARSGSALGHKYVYGECVREIDGKICADYNPAYCPKVYFTGNMSSMTDKKDVRNITFEYRSREQNLTGSAKIKIQGTSSTRYEKKNYTINFYKDNNYSNEMAIDVGWGKQDEYCLKANWIDKTHSRNVVTAKLAGMVQAKYGVLSAAPNNGAIDGFPVEIFINDEFHGLYTMNIPKDAWQFNMDENNPNHIVICGENHSDVVHFKEMPTNLNDWSVEVGPENDETLQKLQRLSSFIMNSTDQEFVNNFDQYLDLDSTLNYYVMLNYVWMPDNRGKNMLLATYDGKVWYPSLYDLDTTWGVDWEGKTLYNYQNNLFGAGSSMLWMRLEKLFKPQIAKRYFELRADVLDTQNVMTLFNSFYASIPKEVLDRETAKWNKPEAPIPGYDLSQIQGYLNSVIPRLDAKYSAWR